MPSGTSGNYFPTRAALILAMAERVFERLTPDPERLAALATLPPDDAAPAYVGDVVRRLIDQPDLARALLEIRLVAARSPEVAEVVGPFLRQGLDDDVEFHRARGLAGGRTRVIRLHHLVNGILLDHLTVPLDPDADPVATAVAAVRDWPVDDPA